MKLVFVHDGPIFYDKNNNYFEFAYHELFERYSYLADEITFMMRTKPIEGEKKFTLVPKAINIVDIPNFKSPKTYIKNRKKAEIIIKKCIYENDYIVLRSQSSIAQIAIKYIKKYNKPYIIECVGCSWDSYWNHSYLGKIVAPYMYYKTRNIIKHADFVYYVTTKFLQKRYPTKGTTVCCSNVVLEPIEKKILSERIQKIKNFNPSKKLILGTAAAIDTRYKGQEYVIQAIKHLEANGYNVEYWLAGGVTGLKPNTFLHDLALSYGILDKVKFVGSLSAKQMPEFYDSLDIYIQPSKQEGLPRAVIEAMSRGCPVIGSNLAGIPELLPSDCLFKKGKYKEIVSSINYIIKSDMEKLAIRNFEYVQKYEKNLLQLKRQAFYDEFLKNVNSNV